MQIAEDLSEMLNTKYNFKKWSVVVLNVDIRYKIIESHYFVNTNNTNVMVIRRGDQYVLLHYIDNNNYDQSSSFTQNDILRLKQSFQNALPS